MERKGERKKIKTVTEPKPKGETVQMLIGLAALAFIIGAYNSESPYAHIKIGEGIGTIIGLFLFSGIIGGLFKWLYGKWKKPFVITFFVLVGCGIFVREYVDEPKPKPSPPSNAPYIYSNRTPLNRR